MYCAIVWVFVMRESEREIDRDLLIGTEVEIVKC